MICKVDLLHYLFLHMMCGRQRMPNPYRFMDCIVQIIGNGSQRTATPTCEFKLIAIRYNNKGLTIQVGFTLITFGINILDKSHKLPLG